jgi:hypothetical protein
MPQRLPSGGQNLTYPIDGNPTVMTGTDNSARSRVLQRIRSLGCLFALVLLQAPAITAAAIAATGACCSADNCPLAARHHPAASEPSSMDCAHDADNHSTKMRSCSMACCHPAQPAAIHSVAFTEPPALASVTLALLFAIVSVRALPENAGFFSPLSPPPKPL